MLYTTSSLKRKYNLLFTWYSRIKSLGNNQDYLHKYFYVNWKNIIKIIKQDMELRRRYSDREPPEGDT